VNQHIKLLLLCKKFPFPLKDGESIAIHNLTKSLHHEGCDITLLCLNTSKHNFDLSSLPPHVDQYSQIHSVDINTDVSAKGAFKNLFTKDSYHISRFNSSAFKYKLQEILQVQNYDIVQLETLTMAVYLPEIKKYSSAAVVMRAHNVEHQIWDRLSKNIKSPIRKTYIKYLSKKLKRFELAKLKEYDLLLTVSKNDLKLFQDFAYQGPAQVVPIGLDLAKYKPSKKKSSKDLFFIGSMDWLPNSYGLNWFIQNVWSELLKKYPNKTLHIAGRNSKSLESTNGISNYGEVESALEFMDAHEIMIVPLLSGSGTRVKIIEGLALGKVIVSTRIGAEGIDLVDGKHILFADTKEEFVSAISSCFENPDLLNDISMQARSFVEEKYNAERIAHNLVIEYKRLIGDK